ncbi:hypothetical protein D1007_12208 [Hordeum vulgare]|nr:hypothetical protein D1007_12208 [Hordeum vulgare]
MPVIVKKEPVATFVVKKEHEATTADLDAGLKWSHDDYVREEMERQIRALHRGRGEGDVIGLSDSDEVTTQTLPVHSDYPGQGCSKDEDDPLSNGNGDYTTFYKLLGMN